MFDSGFYRLGSYSKHTAKHIPSH